MEYLVLVDSYSNWFEIDLLRSLTSTAVITKLKRHFLVHGCPQKVITDNGTQFSSQQFKNSASSWDFVHITSSPEYPQSNGLAERAVRSAKELMEKSKWDGTDVFLKLLNLRNIPRDGILGSPAEILLSRQTRTTLPIDRKLLVPSTKSHVMVRNRLAQKRHQQKRDYDKSSKPLRPLFKGEVVRLQTPQGYKKVGIIKDICKEPRSYLVESEGRDYRRNRRHILPVPETLPQQNEWIQPSRTFKSLYTRKISKFPFRSPKSTSDCYWLLS